MFQPKENIPFGGFVEACNNKIGGHFIDSPICKFILTYHMGILDKGFYKNTKNLPDIFPFGMSFNFKLLNMEYDTKHFHNQEHYEDFIIRKYFPEVLIGANIRESERWLENFKKDKECKKV